MDQTSYAEPVPSATVILLREVEGTHPAWETFMIRRPAASVFAGDMYVFPGGKIDPQDRDPHLTDFVTSTSLGPVSTEWERDEWLAFHMAGVRELFEEAGILLAARDGEPLRASAQDSEKFERYRGKLDAGAITMLEIARREDLRYAVDWLRPIARWITPEPFPRRFDAVFFVAPMPPGQTPRAHHRETTDSLWISPQEALRRHHEGSFPLVFATERVLRSLAPHDSVDEVLRSVSGASLAPVLPRMVKVGGELRFLIPGDEIS